VSFINKVFAMFSSVRRLMSLHHHLGKFLLVGLLALSGLGLNISAQAEAYPTRSINIFVGFPAGGAADIVARMIGEQLSAKLGQPVVVINKPGAASTIGMVAAAAAPNDGYNLLLSSLTNQVIAGHLYKDLKVNILTDFEPVAMIANAPHVLNVNAQVPAQNLKELIAWLKANNGKINYASQGNGTLSHLESALLAEQIGVDLVHVPYKGSAPAVPDLVAGNVSFMFDSAAASKPLLDSGKVRALAVAATQRLPGMPELPTMIEAGLPGYNVNNWMGIYAPKGTPVEFTQVLEQTFAQILADPAFQKTLVEKGLIATPMGAKELTQRALEDSDRWGKVIKANNISF
jgi:tripartite-type tricarboxylate transporter receptor subunit TctC